MWVSEQLRLNNSMITFKTICNARISMGVEAECGRMFASTVSAEVRLLN